MAKATLDRFGKIDVLINNAGIMPVSPLIDLKIDDWNKAIDINIRSVLHGIAAALPSMLDRGSGHIINIGSVASLGSDTEVVVRQKPCAVKSASNIN